MIPTQPKGSCHFTCNVPFHRHLLSALPHVSYISCLSDMLPPEIHFSQAQFKGYPFVKMALALAPPLLIYSVSLLCNAPSLFRENTLYTCPPPPVDCELLAGGWFPYPPQPKTVAYKKRTLNKRLSGWKEIIIAGCTFKGRCKWVLDSGCFAEQC